MIPASVSLQSEYTALHRETQGEMMTWEGAGAEVGSEGEQRGKKLVQTAELKATLHFSDRKTFTVGKMVNLASTSAREEPKGMPTS